MTFPFPRNPVDGQTVTHQAPDGTLLLATYSAAKNCWNVERALKPAPLTLARTGVSIPTATADKQVMMWDATGNQWVASSISLTTRDLGDVDKGTAPADQYFLVFDGVLRKYKPVPLTGGTVLTVTTVGLNTKITTAGSVSAALTVLFKQAKPTSTPKGGDAYIVTEVAGNVALDKYAGAYLYDGTQWLRAGNDSGGAAAHYRATVATPQVPGKKPGDIDVVSELNDHQINVFDGISYQTILGEREIKQWIAAGSLFQGTLKTDGELNALPAAGISNRGFYWTWTGAPSHAITRPLTTTLQVGDWIQSDGTNYIHVPSDLMSKQRWSAVGSFRTWADGSYELDTLVTHNFKLYRATSDVSPGDLEPGTAGSKWQEIQVKLALEELTNVNDNASVYGQDCVLVWDDGSQEWTASRTIQIDAIEFDESGPATLMTGIAASSLTLTDPTANPEQWVPSVYAVKDAISAINLEGLENTKELATAVDGDAVVYNGTLNRWEPKRSAVATLANIGDVNIATLPTNGQVLSWDTASNRWIPKAAASSPILFIGSGALVAANIAVAASNYGMPADTVPPPASYSPAPGDQYLDLMTGVVTAFTGTVVGTPRAGTITGVVAPATKDLIPEVLDKLLDVTITNPADKQILQYDNAASQWKNWTPDYLNPNNGYTKTEVDSKFTAIVTGLNHLVAVLAIADTPPAAPSIGQLYIVGATPTGVWVGQANNLSRWDGTAWQFTTPGNKEAHLVEDQAATYTWNNTAWVKVASASTGGANDSGDIWQVGSIQQSMLTEPQWATLLGPVEGAKWVLADGRNCTGTKFAQITGKTNLPDLRGAFLRSAGQNRNGYNRWNGGDVGQWYEDSTALPKTAFTTSSSGAHTHTANPEGYYASKSSSGTWAIGSPVVHDGQDGRMTLNTSTAGAHTHTIGGGDIQTAPVHVAVNVFIKIN